MFENEDYGSCFKNLWEQLFIFLIAKTYLELESVVGCC